MPKSMIDDQYLLATNPETAPEILRELSQSDDRAIRQAVAGNPNVPIEILWELLVDFPHEIIANSSFSLIMLETQNWILEIPESSLIALLKQRNIPHIFITECRKHKSVHTRDAVVEGIMSNPETTTEQLEEITLTYDSIGMRSVHHSTIRSIIHHPHIQIASLKKIASHCNAITQFDLVGYCLDERYALPRHLQRQILLDEVLPVIIDHSRDTFIIEALLLSESLPQRYIQSILSKHPEVQIRRAKLASTPTAVLTQIFKNQLTELQDLINQPNSSKNHKIRLAQALVRNSQTPDYIIQQFADSPYKAVRAQVARQIALSSELFVKLAQDSYPRTILNLLANRKIKYDLLAELTKHPDPKVSKIAKQHPNTPKSAR
jgi:hypothetical protein